MRASLCRSIVLAAASWAAAASLPSPATAAITDVVEPCDGAGANDLMSYCCKDTRSVPLLFLTDPAGTGYDAVFLNRAKAILGAHNIQVHATYAGDGLLGEQRSADNLPELCEIVIDALTGQIDKIKNRLPVVFTTYTGGAANLGPDSFGMHIADLQTTCEAPLREWHSDDPERLEKLLNRLDRYEVVVINTYELEDGVCTETLAHEIGHSAGLGHDGDTTNVMSSCTPGTPHDGLTHHQVAKLCPRKRFNSLITLP